MTPEARAVLERITAVLRASADALAALAQEPAAAAPAQTQTTTPELITVAEAAALCRRKPATIYEWSRGASWAVRPSPRTLLLNKAQFLAWLARPRRAAA